jgi:hypothetical protein
LCVFSISTRVVGRRDDVARRHAGRQHVVRVNTPAAADLGELDAGVGAAAAHLGPHGVALAAHEHGVARPRQNAQRHLVGHRARRHHSAASLPRSAATRSCSAVTGRVLSELIVADRRRGHRGAHRVGRAGDGVGAEVDHRLSQQVGP